MSRRTNTPSGSRRSRRRTRIGTTTLLLAAAIGLACTSARGQPTRDDDPALRDMQERVRGSRMEVKREGGEPVRIEPIGEPLLRFNDPARESSDGAMWAWGTGRPLAFTTLEHDDRGWSQALVSLRTEDDPRFSLTTRDDWTWSPEEPGIEFAPFPEAPPPADSKPVRLLQAKRLARRLALGETWQGETFALRLLPQPIHRYADEEEGILDGMLFVFAHGTNPEAVLVLECHADEKQPWRYGFAPAADAKLTARLNDAIVWTRPRHQALPNSQTPYAIVRRDGDSE